MYNATVLAVAEIRQMAVLVKAISKPMILWSLFNLA